MVMCRVRLGRAPEDLRRRRRHTGQLPHLQPTSYISETPGTDLRIKTARLDRGIGPGTYPLVTEVKSHLWMTIGTEKLGAKDFSAKSTLVYERCQGWLALISVADK
jgi:hypothetical protein